MRGGAGRRRGTAALTVSAVSFSNTASGTLRGQGIWLDLTGAASNAGLIAATDYFGLGATNVDNAGTIRGAILAVQPDGTTTDANILQVDAQTIQNLGTGAAPAQLVGGSTVLNAVASISNYSNGLISGNQTLSITTGGTNGGTLLTSTVLSTGC